VFHALSVVVAHTYLPLSPVPRITISHDVNELEPANDVPELQILDVVRT